jgi:hypothetical protein
VARPALRMDASRERRPLLRQPCRPPVVHRKGGTGTEGTSQVRSWWDEGGPFVRTISTMRAGQILWPSAMNKGVVPLLHGIDFGSAPQPFRPVRFRILKDGR